MRMYGRLGLHAESVTLPLLAPDAPVATPCAFNRIGEVAVTGAPREEVPQLAVLEGTFDDPERTDRIVQIATNGLRARGYADAAISIARRPGCRVDLHVALGRQRVHPGEAVGIGAAGRSADR